MKKIYAIVLTLLFFVCFNAQAATHTVKTSGGDYSAPGTCANAASPGDICEVYNGTYSGWTQTANGSAGSGYITIKAASGQTPALSSGISINGRSYIHIEGLSINGGVSGNSSRGSYFKVINNSMTAYTTLNADHVLVEGNTYHDLSDDAVRQFGQYWVVRNNTMTGNTPGAGIHMDFWQSWCESGRVYAASYSLIENNTVADNSGGNTHFALINITNACTEGVPTRLIYRYNKVHNIGSLGVYIDDNNAASGTTKNVVYNNTFSYLSNGTFTWEDVSCVLDASTSSSAINNLHHTSMKTSSAIGFLFASGGYQAYNLYYSSSGTMTFSGGAASETGAVKNQDPLLADPNNYDFTLDPGSPAINVGGPLTTTTNSGSSSTSLTVNKSEFFQDGSWISGVSADWIAIGTVSNISQISSINYSTNAIALASPLTWSNGASVWLYKKSDGVRVLYGTAPDIGAMEYQESESDVTPPTLSTKTIGTNGSTLTLVFDEVVDIGSGGNEGWIIYPSGGTATLTYASGSGSATLIYNISRVIKSGESIVVSYTQPGNGVEDSANNDLVSFSNSSITNNSTVTNTVRRGHGVGSKGNKHS